MTSEPAVPAESGATPDLAALTRIVAQQRAELDRLHDLAATSAVLERAKGALMALTGSSPDAAFDELARRAKSAGRTLLEECWLTLGDLVPPLPPTAPQPEPSRSPFPEEAGTGHRGALEDQDIGSLARLARALIQVRSPHDLAAALLTHLAPGVGADAVMVFARHSAGGLELVGHAGIDDTLAAQWHQVPPVSGVLPLDALDTCEERWLEDIGEAGHGYLIIGEPPDRWKSRAWLPVVVGDSADVTVGVLRGRAEPFGPRVREHLRAATRLCAGRLRSLDATHEDGADAATDVVQTVLDVMPGATLLLTPLRSPTGGVEDFRIDAAAPTAVDAAGRTGRELVGLRLREYRPTVATEPLWQGCLRTLATGEPYESEPFAQRQSVGGTAELATWFVRVAKFGDGLVVTWIRHDPSDRQEQRLADVQRLGNLGWASWNLLTHETTWSAQAFAVLGRDPERGPLRLTELPALALPEDLGPLAGAVGRLLREGRPLDVPFRIRVRAGVRHLRAVAEAVGDSSGTPIQVHGFLQDVTPLRSAEIALMQSERAIHTQHSALQAERSMAARLQHALLPLPGGPLLLAGLRVDVAYLPAQSGLNVGGDWFSAVELPDGDALFVVGDVAGHGIDAVATMAQLRFTTKGMVSTGSSLTGALTRLNALLKPSRDAHGTATVILARYHADGRRMVWTQAGHPPPVLLRGGRARLLDRPAGMLLGASDTPRYEAAELGLLPGDRLVLYTDGLVERPGEVIDLGLARLVRAVEAQASGPPGATAPLHAELLESDQRDDVCVLDIRVPV
ncbi:SpoIIE family protein phosphatase [Streptomyces actuosus]|uniref:SpoIIE family protein phosphatase n=1 Tax=Streptomyces actuosus TaxID=1885 RepID=A0ABS2VHR2_STRAS|nr:SpoIIE family protein phosphatase [Streptomyces actuosus]MBN0042624.1 SpoIIE family protein phosphatase [Streptomyces actuosus]